MSVFEKYFKAVGPNLRECKINNCGVKIQYESAKKHSSNLRNHLNNKHSKNVFEEPNAKISKITDYIVPSGSKDKYTNLLALDRQAIAACCSSHVIPYDIVEDDVFQRAYPWAIKSRKQIAERVATIANESRMLSKRKYGGITADEGTAVYESWIKHVLPECRHDAYNKEKELLEESLLLEDPADLDKYPIHRLLLNTVKKIAISEAAVERAFSRHKLVHNRLRASLQESTMDNQLFSIQF